MKQRKAREDSIIRELKEVNEHRRLLSLQQTMIAKHLEYLEEKEDELQRELIRNPEEFHM